MQWGRSYIRARKPGRFIRLGPLSHLGAAIPYAMAAKLAHPESKVLALMGDGSFGFYTMEYDTAFATTCLLRWLWATTPRGGIDKNFQLAYFNRAVGRTCGSYGTTKWWTPSAGYSEYVEKPDDVAPAVERAFASGLPSLVNVVVRSGISPLADAMIARRQGS